MSVMAATDVRAHVRRWVGIWLASRVVLAVLVVVAAGARGVDAGLRASDPARWLLYRFAHWDSHLYAAIAARGYVADGPGRSYVAFFPGMPAVMKGWTLVTGTDGRWGALLLVVVTGAVGAVLLGALAVDVTGRADVGTWAVVLLATTPLTIFLSVVYTEAVFLCLSVGAWLAARRHRWLLAGLLAAIACTLRVNGLFLVAGLAVLHLVRERDGRLLRIRPGAWSLLLGPVLVAGWLVHLHALTGDWNAWIAAQEQGWGRVTTWPWTGISVGIGRVGAAGSWHLALSRLLDVAAWVAAIVVPVWFAVRRNWPVVVLLGLNALTLLTSSILDSGARYLLVWFPVYVALAACVADRPRARTVLLGASAAFALVLAWSWSQQYWVA
jgi:hypothetical protein